MFELAILIGIYSYVIYSLGQIHVLNSFSIFLATVIYVIGLYGVFSKFSIPFSWKYKKVDSSVNLLSCVFLLLLIVQGSVYLLGALSPELAYDALWYHLTLPKIYVESNAIEFIPGGLLYYSAMPKLTEMLFTAALGVGDEITAKVIHWMFGILVLISIYQFSRKYFSITLSLLAALLFYSNLVVAWESTTAYIDLARTFFEFLAFWGFVNYLETKKREWFIESAVMVGLAISTKLIALTTIVLFAGLIVFLIRNLTMQERFKKVTTYTGIALLIPLPWFIFSFMNTGNPIFPLFSQYYSVTANSYTHIPFDLWNIFVTAADPIHPVYIIAIPLLVLTVNKSSIIAKALIFYALFATILWIFIPRTGGGRFMMVYLPVLSILVVYIIHNLKIKLLTNILIAIIILMSVTTIGVRVLAQMKYIPYLTGTQSKEEFLVQNLNYAYGDFYDIDKYFEGRIQKNDIVLIYGIHNLFYVNFPFKHASYIQPGDTFNYILMGSGEELPERFSQWELIYRNTETNVRLYSFGGQTWEY